MVNKKDEANDPKDMKNNVFSYFLLFFPVLIIAAIPSTINGSTMQPLALKILLMLYEFVVIKNFVDKYYGE